MTGERLSSGKPGGRIPGLERRPVVPGGPEITVLGAPVNDALTAAPPVETERLGVALLHRAWEAGIEFFDAGPSTSAAPCELLIGRAFPSDRYEIGVSSTLAGETGSPGIPRPPAPGVVPLGGGTSNLFRQGPEDWPAELNGAVGRALRRLGRERLTIAWFSPRDSLALGSSRVVDALRAESRVGAWGFRVEGQAPDPVQSDSLMKAGVRVFGVPFHLLNAPDCATWIDYLARRGARVVSLDPHAEGLLNGDRLTSPGGPARSTPSPARDWQALRTSWEAISRLGFLTREKRRTLGQAALQFVLDAPGVISALVPIHDPTRLAEWRAALDRPPLTEEERVELLRPASRSRGGPEVEESGRG